MSWRTLVEINHDYIADMERDPEAFVRALMDQVLERTIRPVPPPPRGIRLFGRRHHGDAFKINWGGIEAEEGYTP